MRYLIQAILTHGETENVIDSIRSDDYKTAITFLMLVYRRLKGCIYSVTEIKTGEPVLVILDNYFQ